MCIIEKLYLLDIQTKLSFLSSASEISHFIMRIFVRISRKIFNLRQETPFYSRLIMLYLKIFQIKFTYQIAILSRKNSLGVVKGFLLDNEKFVELVLDCSITISKRTLQLDDSMVLDF